MWTVLRETVWQVAARFYCIVFTVCLFIWKEKLLVWMLHQSIQAIGFIIWKIFRKDWKTIFTYKCLFDDIILCWHGARENIVIFLYIATKWLYLEKYIFILQTLCTCNVLYVQQNFPNFVCLYKNLDKSEWEPPHSLPGIHPVSLCNSFLRKPGSPWGYPYPSNLEKLKLSRKNACHRNLQNRFFWNSPLICALTVVQNCEIPLS